MAKAKPARKAAKAERPKAKPARPKQAKAKPGGPKATAARRGKPRSPAAATWSTPSTREEAKAWTAKRVKPVRRGDAVPKACPICGSKRLEVRPADTVPKAAAKVVAGIAVPLVVRVHPEIDCLSCGWRSEATA